MEKPGRIPTFRAFSVVCIPILIGFPVKAEPPGILSRGQADNMADDGNPIINEATMAGVPVMSSLYIILVIFVVLEIGVCTIDLVRKDSFQVMVFDRSPAVR